MIICILSYPKRGILAYIYAKIPLNIIILFRQLWNS